MQVGDKVRCINQGASKVLVIGVVYTIKILTNSDLIIGLEELPDAYSYSLELFEPVALETPKDDNKYSFVVGHKSAIRWDDLPLTHAKPYVTMWDGDQLVVGLHEQLFNTAKYKKGGKKLATAIQELLGSCCGYVFEGSFHTISADNIGEVTKLVRQLFHAQWKGKDSKCTINVNVVKL